LTESKQGFQYFKQVGIGALSGAAALALIIGGFSISGGGLPAASPTATDSGTPTQTPSASASPTPTDARTCSVYDQVAAFSPETLQAVVINPATEEVLFDRSANTPASTASTMKMLTAVAALQTLGPNYRAETRVYQDPAEPGTIILVGGGDPTLSSTPAGKQSVYRDAPKLSTLAVTTLAKLAGAPITKIVVDSSLFAGASWEASWERSEQTQGYMSEVTALQTDGDRSNPAAETSPRSTSPVLNTGKYFRTALGGSAKGAKVVEGVLPASATEISKVLSQPISRWITHMLQVSDNTQAEALARLISLDAGFDGSFASINSAMKKALAGTGLDLTGVVIKDGSGLSDFNAVSPTFLAKLSALIMAGAGDYALVKAALPVSGESGSLASRFKGDNLDASGKVHAKTGWIKKGYTLAGYIDSKDGTPLVFAVYALGTVNEATKQKIDNLVTGFYRCGNLLSNSTEPAPAGSATPTPTSAQ
jgi:D-alanyl-D-alanine carboxypeptidase/D-alanyl-D-alanine-endopeptidase (penicillin-binding protein 4)